MMDEAEKRPLEENLAKMKEKNEDEINRQRNVLTEELACSRIVRSTKMR
jgi:hypothetical protein